MPYISFETGSLNADVKRELIQKLTEVSVEVTGIPKEFFMVSIKEFPDHNVAVGGRTVAEIKVSQ